MDNTRVKPKRRGGMGQLTEVHRSLPRGTFITVLKPRSPDSVFSLYITDYEDVDRSSRRSNTRLREARGFSKIAIIACQEDHVSSQYSWTRFHNYYKRESARLVFRKPLAIRTQRPLISFTFDDFPRSAFLTGGPILSLYRLAGTYFTPLRPLRPHRPPPPFYLCVYFDTFLRN